MDSVRAMDIESERVAAEATSACRKLSFSQSRKVFEQTLMFLMNNMKRGLLDEVVADLHNKNIISTDEKDIIFGTPLINSQVMNFVEIAQVKDSALSSFVECLAKQPKATKNILKEVAKVAIKVKT